MQIFLILSLLFPLFAFAGPSPAVLSDPLAMTITRSLSFPKEDKATRETVILLPERKNVFLFEDKAALKFTYQLQAQSTAPLVFIIPGAGASAQSSGALFLAEKFFNLGYSTVTVDNAFSWQFAIAGSSNGLPGYIPQDAKDLYRALQAITQKIKQEKAIHPRSYSLAGYSLGASQSLFIQKLDEEYYKAFGFAKVLLVDPPTDLFNAMAQLDQLFETGETLSAQRKATIFNQTLEFGSKFLAGKAQVNVGDAHSLQRVFDKLQFGARDLSYLIGRNFRDSLRDLVFASQQINDLKILKSTVTRYHRNQRYEESYGFNFNDYMTRFVFPALQKKNGPGYTVENLNQEVSLYQFESHLKSRKNIFLVHSEDDFVLKAGDVEWLKNTFGDRALIFPYGGHCGAMNFPQFTEYLKAIFK